MLAAATSRRRARDPLEIPAFLRRVGGPARDETEHRPDFMDQPSEPVTGVAHPGVTWREVFWANVEAGGYKAGNHRNEVSDPPCNGWSHALFIEPREGGKFFTIFCPYSMRGFAVSVDSTEVFHSRDVSSSFRRGYVVGLMLKRWERNQRLGLPIDLDLAAMALSRLGAQVPTRAVQREGGVTADPSAPSGGKPAAGELLKPVRAGGKRGRFLAWFLEAEGRSVREAMAEFGMTRSNALSYWFALNKDHGIGYELVGDAVRVTLPPGCSDPFSAEEPF